MRQDIKNTPPMTQSAPAIKDAPAFKRAYRDHRVEWMLRSGGARVVWDGMKNGTIRFSNEIQ